MKIEIIQGDCLIKLKELPDNSVDSIVTDPPYELGFMGKSWDSTGIANNVDMWKECLRVLKPGGHLLSFSGTRTYHRMACAIEDAGFEVKNMIAWCYGQGFPKSLRVGCNCDRGMLPYNNDKVSLSSKEELPDLPQGVFVSKQISGKEKQGLLKEMRGTSNIKKENGDKEETACDLQTLQERVLPEVDSESKDSLLFAEVQRDSEVGTSKKVLGKRQRNKKSKEGIENGKEPSVERGSNLLEETRELQADKVCEMPKRISSDGSEGQLHNGTSFGNGDALETDIDEDRGGASYQSRPTRQQNRESDVISEQSGTQTTRREICKKCGGIIGMEGYGTALKPAIEPICMAMKPISERTIRLNVLKWGTGGLNIDISRITPNDEVSQQNNPENAKGGIVVSDKHEFYPSSLADAFSYSLQQLQDFFQHIASVRTSYSISDITPLSSAKVVFHNQGSQLLGVPCDYDDLVKRVYECASAELSPQGSLNGYPILSRLCGEYAHPDVKGDREIFLLSTDVPSNIDRLSKELHTPSGHNNQFLVFVLVLFAYDLFNTLYHNDTTSKNKMQVGRFPANLITDGSEEVKECFPESTSGSKKANQKNYNHEGKEFVATLGASVNEYQASSGNASRFFKSIIYQAKASKSERNKGCEELDEISVKSWHFKCKKCGKTYSEQSYKSGCHCENPDVEEWTGVSKNNHPTVKPIALMEYLIKMVTPKKTYYCEKCYGKLNMQTVRSTVYKEGETKSSSEFLRKEVCGNLVSKKQKDKKGMDDNEKGIQDDLLSRKSNGNETRDGDGTQVNNGELLEKKSISDRGNTSQESQQIRQQDRKPGTDRKVNSRQNAKTEKENNLSSLSENCRCPKCGEIMTEKPGVVLDCFMGSGSTGVACKQNGYSFIGIELDPEYIKIAEARIKATKVENKLL